ILSIDTAAAKSAPGVLGVWTGEDYAASGLGNIPCAVPRQKPDGTPMFTPPNGALCKGAAKMVGDPVCWVVAETAKQAQDAAETILVDYEETKPITNTAHALDTESGKVWDEAPDNVCFVFELGDKDKTDAAFASAHHVTKLDINITRVSVAPMEPRACIGDYDRYDERFTLITGTQGPHGVRAAIAEPILREVRSRLGFLRSVGLDYLTLDRSSGTLSGGEAQRIRLATQVGSGLVGVCYVLDEPTIGLHQRDNDRLIATLRHLTDIGNTVLVVEHDEDVIRHADHVVDIGPGPGLHGGRVVAQGTPEELEASGDSLTGAYLSGRRRIEIPEARRSLDVRNSVVVKGAAANNLKSIDATFPLGGIVCVTGVSGSGKSSLVNEVLLKAAMRTVTGTKIVPGPHTRINGLQRIDRVVDVDQSPIGRTPRSNPATYTGIFDQIRKLFCMTNEAKIRGYQPGRFSFNVKGGRCEECQGQGVRRIEMHFLPDVFVECEACRGRRYNRETLEVRYRGKNIADVLDLTVEDAVEFFEAHPRIHRMLTCIRDVGLDYMKLGQASTTLSGGEAQRVKLASELGSRPTGHTLYVLDEPTTGLHFDDVRKLLDVLQRLADAGNTLVVIEHNLEVIKCADLILDLGPEGGDRGGEIVATGTPEELADMDQSHTGRWLRTVLPAFEKERVAIRAAEAERPSAPTGNRKKKSTASRTVAKTKKTGSRKKAVAKKPDVAKAAAKKTATTDRAVGTVTKKKATPKKASPKKTATKKKTAVKKKTKAARKSATR
ncbi:MAG: excinuclease ABC subunit A, partial [Phycisphaerae bacterium]|nr:excinuclease ABC subunit A [Phycisphaerae bacterium]